MVRSMKRKLAIVGIGVGMGAASWAAAASLGVTSTTLGAGEDSVDSCDTDGINAAYTSNYDATSGEFEVDSVDLTNVAAGCSGKSLTVVLSGPAATPNVVLEQVTVAATGGNQSVAFVTGVDAEDVVNIDVQLNG